MTRYVNSLLVALLITGSTFSQTTYPQLLIKGADTLVVITLPQMDSVNSTFIWNDQLRVTVDSLTRNLHTTYQLSHLADSTSRQQLLISASRIADRDNLIAAQGVLVKEQKKQINKLRATKTVLGISTTVFGVATVILLILL